MDNKICENEIDGSQQQSQVSFSLGEPVLGSWTIEKNFPYGFVIRNVDPSSLGVEYHFHYASNGWLTAKNKTSLGVFNSHGQTNGTAILVDKESTRKQERISELKNKGNDLTDEEARELLRLCGLLKVE